ncbi:hypothetical protein Tco_0916552 [Tanacetum coccineum]
MTSGHEIRGVIEEDEKREAQQKAEQDIIDQEALRFTLEEGARCKIGFRLVIFELKNKSHCPIADGNADLRITGAQPIAAVTPSADKGKQLTEPNEKASHEPQDKKTVAYKLELPQELSRVHNTFHVSNLKKCYSDNPLALQVDDKFHFVKEPVEIMDREVKQLRRSCVPIVKVRWNSRRGPEFT